MPKSTPKNVTVGSSGLRRTGGYISADFLPELNGLRGRRLLKEMADNDPVVSAFLFAVEMLVRQVEWKVEAADPKSKAADKAREEVEDVLFKRLTFSWPDVVSQVVSMFTYGFAPLETTWRKADSGLIVPHKLDLRGQETIDRWTFGDDPNNPGKDDHGDVTGLWQQDWGRAPVFIPREKVLLFRTTASLNNPEGRSALRGAYVTWVRKRAIEEAEGRALLRAAGLVVVRIPSKLMSEEADEQEKATFLAYQQLATNLANDRQGAVVLPSDVVGNTDSGVAGQAASREYDIEYKMADGRRSADMSMVIERMDKRIATTVMADFLLLGQTAVGSFALSDNKTALFNMAMGAFLDIIAGTFNRQLLQRWWKYNSLPEETMPKLVPGKVQIPSLGELGAFITQLSGAGVPLFPDQELESALRLRAGLPLASDKVLKEREAMQQDEIEREDPNYWEMPDEELTTEDEE